MRPNPNTKILAFLFFYLIISGSTCEKNIFKPTNIYEGCCGTEPLLLDTNNLKLFVPNAITPNADGLNDEFSIYSNRPITIDRLMVAEQSEILAINRSNIRVFGETNLWKPINASGIPIHGLFNYSFKFTAQNGDTLNFSGQFCSIDCEAEETEIVEFSQCILQSITSAKGEIDTSALIQENDCQF